MQKVVDPLVHQRGHHAWWEFAFLHESTSPEIQGLIPPLGVSDGQLVFSYPSALYVKVVVARTVIANILRTAGPVVLGPQWPLHCTVTFNTTLCVKVAEPDVTVPVTVSE